MSFTNRYRRIADSKWPLAVRVGVLKQMVADLASSTTCIADSQVNINYAIVTRAIKKVLGLDLDANPRPTEQQLLFIAEFLRFERQQLLEQSRRAVAVHTADKRRARNLGTPLPRFSRPKLNGRGFPLYLYLTGGIPLDPRPSTTLPQNQEATSGGAESGEA